MPGAVATATAAVSLFILIQLRGHHWIFRCLNFKQGLKFVFSYLTGRSLRGINTYWPKDRMMILRKTKKFNILRKIQIQIKYLVISFAIFKINEASVCVENGVVCHLRD